MFTYIYLSSVLHVTSSNHALEVKYMYLNEKAVDFGEVTCTLPDRSTREGGVSVRNSTSHPTSYNRRYFQAHCDRFYVLHYVY